MTTNPQNGEFCWNELMTSDVSKAKDFYGKLFGWTHQDHPMNNMTYTMFTKGEKMIGGLLQIPEEQKGKIPPHWLSYILVQDLEGKIEEAVNLGATIKVPATAIPGFGRFAIISDPTQAHIALWETTNK